jgi:hypothetical protein
MEHANTLNISRHAQRRMGQRGVTRRRLAEFLEHADKEAHVGSGSTAIRVSRKTAETQNLDDSLCNFAAIIGHDGTLVTIIPMRPGRNSRRYRGRN